MLGERITFADASRSKSARRARERVNQQTDREDRRLVKMSVDELAEGRAHQEWFKRDALFMALIALWVIGMSIYRFFSRQRNFRTRA